MKQIREFQMQFLSFEPTWRLMDKLMIPRIFTCSSQRNSITYEDRSSS